MNEKNWVDHPGVKCLLCFFSKLNDWESETNRLDEGIDWGSYTEEEHRASTRERRDALKAIYDKYCDAGTKATRFKDQGLSYTSHPQHDPEIEKIINVTEGKDKVVVETRYTDRGKWYWKYEVIKVGEEWKVRDVRYSRLKPDKPWDRDLL